MQEIDMQARREALEQVEQAKKRRDARRGRQQLTTGPLPQHAALMRAKGSTEEGISWFLSGE